MDIARRLKPAHLDLIVRIADTSKLQLAAEAMAMSQPAASRTLSEIEAAVGGALFVRHPKGMDLTPAGTAFVRHARVVLAELQTLSDELRHLQSGHLGEVRVGSVTGPAIGCLMPAVQALHQEAPDVRISVDVAPSRVLVRQLEEGRYDFVIARVPPGHDSRGLRLHPARTEIVSLLVHATHPLAASDRVTLSDLVDQPWVMQEPGTPIRQAVEEAFFAEGLPTPHRVLNSSSLLVALAQVANAGSVTPQSQEASQLLVRAEVGAQVVPLSLPRPIVVPPYFVIRHRSQQLPRAAEQLLDAVLARL